MGRAALRIRLLGGAVLAATAVAGVLTLGAGTATRPLYKDASQPVPKRVADLLARMTLAEKVWQMTQVDKGFLSADADITKYRLGSLLSGGGSVPVPNEPAAWVAMTDAYQRAALKTRLGIPLIYGIDAVHGHNNVIGATIFPHNIGLGVTRDAALVRKIGRATAEEVAGTGIRWTFAPCVCVARNIRWGRTYESFSDEPKVASALGAAYVAGFQGPKLGGSPTSILATAKHYVADGGTDKGVNTGDASLSDKQVRSIYLPPFTAAVKQGVGSVMTSFSSIQGEKMHASTHWVTDVLKGELGFKGFVISDWAGVAQIDGDGSLYSFEDVDKGIDAGIDMVMVPQAYQLFQAVLTNEIQKGHIKRSRIDDAVRRILTVKFQLGLFEHPFADRAATKTIGSKAHRALARQAVRESLVLLKNAGHVLPLKKGQRIFVAGKNADDVGAQSGGWTITWQGSTGPITPGTSILQGLKQVAGKGARIDYSLDGRGAKGHDVAIAVLGEGPYAESNGDRPDDYGLNLDAADDVVISNLRKAHIPIVVVLVSGRPLVVTRELPSLKALVAAWLPGTEGAGVADVLFGRVKPTGKLARVWPRSAAQAALAPGEPGALFPYGFGLSYR
ncbi:MAG: beta-glucosidase [Actinomycetota bacterium]|nr:beta-glucosidase [Actinomycetota bacterium]